LLAASGAFTGGRYLRVGGSRMAEQLKDIAIPTPAGTGDVYVANAIFSATLQRDAEEILELKNRVAELEALVTDLANRRTVTVVPDGRGTLIYEHRVVNG
jgi:hypothetical protein